MNLADVVSFAEDLLGAACLIALGAGSARDGLFERRRPELPPVELQREDASGLSRSLAEHLREMIGRARQVGGGFVIERTMAFNFEGFIFHAQVHLDAEQGTASREVEARRGP